MNQEEKICLEGVERKACAEVRCEESLGSWDTCDQNLPLDDVPVWSMSKGCSIPCFLEGTMTRRSGSSSNLLLEPTNKMPCNIKSFKEGLVFVDCKQNISEILPMGSSISNESSQIDLDGHLSCGKDVTSKSIDSYSSSLEQTAVGNTCPFTASRKIQNYQLKYNEDSQEFNIVYPLYDMESSKKMLPSEDNSEKLIQHQLDAWKLALSHNSSHSKLRKVSADSSYHSVFSKSRFRT